MRYADKRFLSTNPQDADESGSMVCALTTDRYEDLYQHTAEKPTVDGSVQVRDCYGKPVTLDFSVRSLSSLQRRLVKLDTMIDMLQKMKAELPAMYSVAVSNGQRWLKENPEENTSSVSQQLGLDTTED